MKVGWRRQSYCNNKQAYFFWPTLYYVAAPVSYGFIEHSYLLVQNSNPLQRLLRHDAVLDELEERRCVLLVREAEHFTGVRVARSGR